ncbi:MAG: putative teichuronic acid biosynthesis glycosyltransferase TuaC [Bacteroidetes bacterium ADurb.Bin174]|nr:MAG: putative teichuronic acid biosynthesis glycosyltransferase TuaC [Bacteroidetes bacterium ADurb.Bin174]
MINKKILVVCSENSGRIAPFIEEQVNALKKNGLQMEIFGVKGKGIRGYLRNRKLLLQRINGFQPDIIHAHYGLSGLLANTQRKVPVITTYHGCDINKFNLRLIALFPLIFSKFNIFVSQNQADKVKLVRKKYEIIPCGINSTDFFPLSKIEQRKKLNWDLTKKIILFSSDFIRPEKNANLAFQAIEMLPGYELMELKGYSRDELRTLMNACDAGLLTSIREGSPMFVKEMMACGRPLVCTDVGDVRIQIEGVEGCEIVGCDPLSVKEALERVVQVQQVSYPSIRLKANDNNVIAEKIRQIYISIIE